MIRIVKSAVFGMAVAATTLSGIPAANAGTTGTTITATRMETRSPPVLLALRWAPSSGAFWLSRPTIARQCMPTLTAISDWDRWAATTRMATIRSLFTSAVRCSRGAAGGTTTAAAAIAASIRAPELF